MKASSSAGHDALGLEFLLVSFARYSLNKFSWDSDGSAEALRPREEWGADDSDDSTPHKLPSQTREPPTVVPMPLVSDDSIPKHSRTIPRNGYFSDED